MERSSYVVGRARESVQIMQAQGRQLGDLLTYLVREGERVAGGRAVCSVLLLDGDGLLRNGASPGLPADYLAAIDRIRPDPELGTCAAAAATGKIVLTPDFLADRRWKELRHLPMTLGFAGAWSAPIKDGSGAVLGTFGTYFRTRRNPRPAERTTVVGLARIAGEAVEQNRKSPRPGAGASSSRVS